MGIFNQQAIAEDKSKSGGVVSSIKAQYKSNERLIKGIGQAAIMFAALRIAADYMQSAPAK